MPELEFSYDIAGHENVEINLFSVTSLSNQVLSYIFTKTSGPLTFSYDIAGHQNEINHLRNTTRIESSSKRKINTRSEVYSRSRIELSRKWKIRRKSDTTSCTWLNALHYLNLGYAKEIVFGNVVLRHARYDAIDEVEFPFREKRLYGGYRSIRSVNVRGYSGSFIAVTDDWNDIQSLMDLIGQPRTLRIWGKPYRNCYIKPPIRIKTVKKGVNLWYYWVSIYQDSAIVEVSS